MGVDGCVNVSKCVFVCVCVDMVKRKTESLILAKLNFFPSLPSSLFLSLSLSLSLSQNVSALAKTTHSAANVLQKWHSLFPILCAFSTLGQLVIYKFNQFFIHFKKLLNIFKISQQNILIIYISARPIFINMLHKFI